MNKIIKEFDIIIIGAGLSGLVLAYELSKRTSKKILLLEQKKKFENDKNWCFWNFPENYFTTRAENRWKKIFVSIDGQKKIFLEDGIEYLHIRSITFYNQITNEIKKNKNIKILMNQKLNHIRSENLKNYVTTNKKTFMSKLIFDSRPKIINKERNQLFQNFYGATISFSKNLFDKDEVTLMDFQKFSDGIHFLYILPFSKKIGLIESTYFSTKMYTESHYITDIKKYINKRYGKVNYKMNYCESGRIPMFYTKQEPKFKSLIKIGTTGNWVRASTGYCFQNSFKNAKDIVNDILKNKKPRIKFNRIFVILDLIFCEYIKKYPSDSKFFFMSFFYKNKLRNIVKFLTGTSNLYEVLGLLISLPKIKLLKISFKILINKII